MSNSQAAKNWLQRTGGRWWVGLMLLATELILPLAVLGAAAKEQELTIITPAQASRQETLAAQEVRRYVYLCAGQLLTILEEPERLPAAFILVARKDRPLLIQAAEEKDRTAWANLAPEQYWLRGRRTEGGQLRVLVGGGDDVGTLYAAYRLAERLGVRFYLHGDVVPDERRRIRTAAVGQTGPENEMSWVDLFDLNEGGRPAFAVRGILPFHDFPEGPDWWNRDDYLGIISQLPKLGLNFFGLHTYPEGRPNAEPTVWIGQSADIGAKRQVQFAYSSSYQSTARGNWGYVAKKTSDYHLGASQLFETDDYGPEVMAGHLPEPKSAEGRQEVFERTAALLSEAFELAHRLGVKTCVGTEAPLVVPGALAERLRARGENPADPAVVQSLYEGTFRRAAQVYPLDYYWLWTAEEWNSLRQGEPDRIKATVNDFAAALKAHEAVQPPFELAISGWVLGPANNRAQFDSVLPKRIPLSSLNGTVGESPVDPSFGAINQRAKWAIPWLEDDKALTTPQLWAGRMHRDAADARRYGCTGLIGIHWRTRGIGPTLAALAQAAWNSRARAEPIRVSGPSGGWTVNIFPPPEITTTNDPVIYQTVRENVVAYYVPASNGVCQVTLNFCEPLYQEPGQRVFTVKLQGQPVIEQLDIFKRVGRNRSLDFTFKEVLVTNGWVDLEFVPQVEFPVISGLTVSGNGYSHQINCGGPVYKTYLADQRKPPYPPMEDFYGDWARSEFGSEVAQAAAKIFSDLDGYLPRPADWDGGPGALRVDLRPWSETKQGYEFVEKLAALEPGVRGAGNRARFGYWLHSFAYLKAMGELSCLWGEYLTAANTVMSQPGLAQQRALAKQTLIPIRIRSVGLLAKVYDHLFATISSPGDLGTIVNWEQHCLPNFFIKSAEALEGFLGEALPAEAQLPKAYQGPARLIVPSPRGSFDAGEQLTLRVLILASKPLVEAALYWRRMGQGGFVKVPLTQVARGVYSVSWPGGQHDLEYYLKVQEMDGGPLHFPATAPAINQTMICLIP